MPQNKEKIYLMTEAERQELFEKEPLSSSAILLLDSLPLLQSMLDQPEGVPLAWLVPTEIDEELGLMFPFTQIPSDTHPDIKAMLEAFPVFTHPPAPRKQITEADVTDEMIDELARQCPTYNTVEVDRQTIAASVNIYLGTKK